MRLRPCVALAALFFAAEAGAALSVPYRFEAPPNDLVVDVKSYRTPDSIEGLPMWEDGAYGYRVAAFVDKAVRTASTPTGQTITVFVYDEATRSWTHRADMNWNVSTGTEAPKRGGGIGHTPTGFFRAESLRAQYRSQNEEAMPFSVFYHERFGAAIHATAEKSYPLLGRRASIGCTRLRLEQARAFFELIRSIGRGPIVELLENGGLNFTQEEIRLNVRPNGRFDETILSTTPRTTPRVIQSWRALIVNTDTSSLNPADVRLNPEVFVRDPQRLAELFPRLRL